eukprot:m.48362 g.48362  ORF g.48362 m.48362 type:complete len:243 (+) comp6984_c0_seq2:93-821(+)
MAAPSGWKTVLQKHMQAAGVNDDEMVEYASTLVEDADDERDSKIETLTAFLADLDIEDAATPAMEAVTAWETHQAEKQAQASEARRKQQIEARNHIEESTQRILKAGADAKGPAVTDSAAGGTSLGVKDVALRKALVAAYDNGSDDDDDSDGDMGEGGAANTSRRKDRRARKQATAQELAMGHVNTNRIVPQMHQQAAREAARTSAAEKKLHDKQATQADRDKKAQAKEARRAKAAKGERRR